MTCKICHQNETESTSGICWECYLTIIKIPKIIKEPNYLKAEFLGGSEPAEGIITINRTNFYPYRDYLEWILNQPEFWEI